jgi:hypothetical protein
MSAAEEALYGEETAAKVVYNLQLSIPEAHQILVAE